MIDMPAGIAAQFPEVSLPSLRQFLARARVAIGLTGDVSVLLTSDAELQRLNRQFRRRNKPTDVLSFPADPMPGLPAAQGHAGDLAISLDTASRQAIEHGHALPVELRILMLHGLLHLAGMDHETDAGTMWRRESELRARFRLPASLIERTLAGAPTGPRSPTPRGRRP